MTDRIEVRGIRAYGRHGANPGETDVAQPFDLDVMLDVDIGTARRSDALADTVDYAALHAEVVHVVGTHSYALLERLGDELLEVLLRDERVSAARISIAKPRLLDGATPVVTLQRTR